MFGQTCSLEQRRARIERFIARRIKEGFKVVSRSDVTAELVKPAGFPAFLRKEKTLYVDIDEQGRLWVRKATY